MRVPGFITITGALFSLTIGGNAYGNVLMNAPIVYRLCKGEVQSVEMHTEKEKFRVTLKLTDTASEVFSTLTETNIGKVLFVVAGETVVSKASVRTRIDSGRIVSDLLGESEAIELIGLIRDRLPGPPRGVAQQSGEPDAGKRRGASRNAQYRRLIRPAR